MVFSGRWNHGLAGQRRPGRARMRLSLQLSWAMLPAALEDPGAFLIVGQQGTSSPPLQRVLIVKMPQFKWQQDLTLQTSFGIPARWSLGETSLHGTVRRWSAFSSPSLPVWFGIPSVFLSGQAATLTGVSF